MKSQARSDFSPCALIGFFVAGIALSALGGERPDVSRLIDQATAESVLGEKVKIPTPRNLDGEDGYYSKCNYYSATSNKTLVLRLYQAAAGFNARQELEAVRVSTGTPKPVAGLGDKAQVYSGSSSGLSANVVMLYVIKGNSLVTVGLSGFDEETALEQTKKLAQKIVTQIP